jgi:hypothetical protein
MSKALDLLLQPFVQSIEPRMLLRGIVSYGTYYLSERLIIGPAIDDAAEHHAKINWVGISVSPNLSIAVNDFSSDGVIHYKKIPHKKSYYTGFVLNWPKVDSNRECHKILLEESKRADAASKIKYDNTFKFYHEVTHKSY